MLNKTLEMSHGSIYGYSLTVVPMLEKDKECFIITEDSSRCSEMDAAKIPPAPIMFRENGFIRCAAKIAPMYDFRIITALGGISALFTQNPANRIVTLYFPCTRDDDPARI